MESKDGSARRIVIVVFPGVQSLDLTGPVEVFATANRYLGARSSFREDAGYDVRLVAPEPGPVTTSSGLTLCVDRRLADVRGKVDTLIVAGGNGTDDLVHDAASIAAVRRRSPR